LLDFSYASQPYQSFFPANNLVVQAATEILKKIYESLAMAVSLSELNYEELDK